MHELSGEEESEEEEEGEGEVHVEVEGEVHVEVEETGEAKPVAELLILHNIWSMI